MFLGAFFRRGCGKWMGRSKAWQRFQCLILLWNFPAGLPCQLSVRVSVFKTKKKKPHDLFSVFIVLPFTESHLAEIIQYVAFSDELLSLGDMHLRFFHVFVTRWLIPLKHWIIFHRLGGPQFIHSRTEGRLDCFWVLAIRNKSAINIHVHVFCGHGFSVS